MQCFGVPVFSASAGPAVAAVAVSLIKAGTSEARRLEIVAAIRALAASLSERLGAVLAAAPAARAANRFEPTVPLASGRAARRASGAPAPRST
jgi:hypothetical protein